ncbi:hypothetical protein QUB63_29570 [Microcoleus sp. ARI1-B5]|uniref:hypothetical protein n=1 Tax=Microcoleus sp. ARI1-A2 TaxID=2818557 RepID=UPI002FCFE281
MFENQIDAVGNEIAPGATNLKKSGFYTASARASPESFLKNPVSGFIRESETGRSFGRSGFKVANGRSIDW